MNELVSWLRELARQNAARPELFEALLTDRPWPYAVYRLRFLLPRVLLRLCLHGLEIYFLAQALPWSYFAPLLSFRAVSSLLGASYWGALEGLRTRVRGELRARHYDRAQRTIEAWLGVSLGLASLCLLGIVLFIELGPTEVQEPGFNLFDAYGLACFVRLACDVVARTYHAGVFAIRRVYRPFWSLALPDAMELLFVLVAWEQLGPWGFPLSIMAMGLLRSAWTLHYAHRAYRYSRIATPVWRRIPHAMRMLGRRDLRDAALHTLANATSQLDALLILALAHAPSEAGDGITFAVLYYALRPLMGAASSWTRAFYFDFKRLEAGTARVFQARFAAILTRVGWGIALGLGACLCATALSLWRAEVRADMFLLVPLFVARSLFSLEQLAAFSLGHYRRLAWLALFVLLALLVFELAGAHQTLLVLGTTAVLALSTALSRLSVTTGAALQGADERVLGLAAFVARLARTPGPVTVGTLCADRALVPRGRMMRALAPLLAGGHAAAIAHAHVVWFAASERAPTRVQLLAGTAGAVRELWLSRPTADGQAALRELDGTGVFERTFGFRLAATAPTIDELRELFARDFAAGFVLDLARGRGGLDRRAFSPVARRALLREIVVHARGRKPRATGGACHDVAVFAPHGMPRVVFAVPRGVRGFKTFAHCVEQASVGASWARGLPVPSDT